MDWRGSKYFSFTIKKVLFDMKIDKGLFSNQQVFFRYVFEVFYSVNQPCNKPKWLIFHYAVTDSSLMKLKSQSLTSDSKNLLKKVNLFHWSHTNPHFSLERKGNAKDIGGMTIETPKSCSLDNSRALGSQAFAITNYYNRK